MTQPSIAGVVLNLEKAGIVLKEKLAIKNN